MSGLNRYIHTYFTKSSLATECHWVEGLHKMVKLVWKKLNWFLQCSAVAADIRAWFCETAAGHGADCSSAGLFISRHAEYKLVINREVFEELPGIVVDPRHVVQYVAGLLHQSAVGISHTQSQTGNTVQQWSQLTRFLEFFKWLVDCSVRQVDLQNIRVV